MVLVICMQGIMIVLLALGFSSSMRNQAETERQLQELVTHRTIIDCVATTDGAATNSIQIFDGDGLEEDHLVPETGFPLPDAPIPEGHHYELDERGAWVTKPGLCPSTALNCMD